MEHTIVIGVQHPIHSFAAYIHLRGNPPAIPWKQVYYPAFHPVQYEGHCPAADETMQLVSLCR